MRTFHITVIINNDNESSEYTVDSGKIETAIHRALKKFRADHKGQIVNRVKIVASKI